MTEPRKHILDVVTDGAQLFRPGGATNMVALAPIVGGRTRCVALPTVLFCTSREGTSELRSDRAALLSQREGDE